MTISEVFCVSLVAFPLLQIQQSSIDSLPLSSLASSILILILIFTVTYMGLAYYSKLETCKSMDSRSVQVSSGAKESARTVDIENTRPYPRDDSGMSQELLMPIENKISPERWAADIPTRDEVEGYCLNCQKDTQIHHSVYLRFLNEIGAVSGECSVCGTRVFRILVPAPELSG